MSRITNRRWATAAFGTASAAALTNSDTVYSVTPLYHPSGLMMSIGGAVAGGARLAMATSFDPDTYWQEVRRYGVTVASYTWTMLHELVAAPPQPGERHHAVRLFIGSGMPRGLWQRVQRRFAPARVLEFYASAETGAILVNVRDAKPGAMGRPLPGSPEVALAAYDLDAGQLVLGDDGFVVRSPDGEAGMLLARSRETTGTSTIALRGVFAPGDAWLATGDMFRRDADGDYFRLDNVRDVIRTAAGPVFTAPIRDALGDLPAVDMAVAYAITDAKGREVAMAAVTLRPHHRLELEDLNLALALLPRAQRPTVVRVVGEIPVTTWYRPITDGLRTEGVPAPTDDQPAFHRGARADTYKPLTAADRKRLTAS